MKKLIVTGALSMGLVVSSLGIQAQAAETVTAPNVLSSEAFITSVANEVNSLSFQDLYKFLKLAELELVEVKTTMSENKKQFTLEMPIDLIVESEADTAEYEAEYAAYAEIFGESIQIKVIQTGNTYKTEMLIEEEWVQLDKEEQAEFLAGFTDEELELKAGGFFTDSTGHWAESYIQFLYQADIITGTSATTFNPNGNVTRGQLVAMIFRASSLDLEEEYTTPASYTDISNFWAAKEVAVLEEYGLLDIFEGTKFEPHKHVTREEMAYVTTYFLGLEGLEIETFDATNTFKDVAKMHEEAVAPIGLLQNLEVIGGVKGEYNPKGNLTRAQFAKILSLSLFLFED